MNISSKKIYNAILAGANEIMTKRVYLNNINVFPVADGDTGSNLFSTMNNIIRSSKYRNSLKDSMDSVADAALIGARGNSGIIFAQYFNGLSKGITASEFSVEQFIKSNTVGYEYACSSIQVPVEGTIISAMKAYVSALEKAASKTSDFIKVMEFAYEEVEKAVLETTNQLKVLKKESVVDSGAEGFKFFIKGFIDFLKGTKEEFERDQTFEFDSNFDSSSHDIQDIEFRYCTEAMFIENKLDTEQIKEELTPFGDSLIVAANERTGRIHIHTDRPDLVFDKIAEFSEVVYQKADDMIRQNEVVAQRKHSIALVTDSIADLPQSLVDQHQIHVVNINILIGKTNYFDKLTINNEMVDKYMNDATNHPTTSQPDIKTIENLYDYLLTYYDSVIVMAVSKELSGTYNVFNKVKQDLGLDDKVTVIDTKQNSGAEGLLVDLCAREIAFGKSHQDVVNHIQSVIKKSKIIVKIKTLKNMISSGRLSTKAGKVANLVNLRPLITLDHEGKGAIEKVAFSDKGATNTLIKQLKKVHKENGIKEYNLVHINNEQEAIDLAKELEDIFGFAPTYITETSSVIAIGAGSGAVAVSFITN